MANDFIEQYKKSRAAAQSQMQGNTRRTFSRANEVQLCGKKNVGMVFGVFLSDKNGLPYRIINGFRSFRINKDVADNYGIKDFELRICNPSQYKNLSADDMKLVTTLDTLLDKIGNEWDAWADKIAKYPPQWYKTMTIQYMKVVRRVTAEGTDFKDFEPGVKVLMSRSAAYCRAFDEYIDGQTAITQDMEGVLTSMLSRDEKVRSQQYMIKSSLPQNAKTYNFSIQAFNKVTEITDEDLRASMDLEREVIDCSVVDSEELKKWIHLFKDTYDGIKNGVYGGPEAQVEEALAAPAAPAPEPVKTQDTRPVEEQIAIPEDEDNPFI